jgi:FKBP-type peptidyl-prolyl cis-trans isomerase
MHWLARAITLAFLATSLLHAGVGCGDRTVRVDQDTSFKSVDIHTGTGLLVTDGALITTHYTVRLPDGTTVIDTRAKGQSHTFRVGDGTVVRAMDRLVRGMREGGVREAIVPPSMHWGSGGYGGVIPPRTTLTFRVEVVDVRTG